MHSPRFYSILIKLALMSFILLFLPIQSGQAASTIMVNSGEDVAKNDGMCTLREAVIAANKDKRSGGKPGECIAGSGADVIMLPAGTYAITRSDSGNEDSASTGDLDILESLTIIGDGADVTLIEGVSINDRIFHVLVGEVTLFGLTMSGGNVPSDGGGIYNEAILTLTDVVVSGNQAQKNGGGLFNAGTLVMTGSTVVGNGAVLDNHEFINSGTASLSNSTISGHGLSNSGTADLSFVTVMGETAVTGGILKATNALFTACSGTITSQGYNLIADSTGCTLSGDLTGNISDKDPLLGMLDDNRGPTPTHALMDGSPAIEAGSNAFCPATDQRGVTRPRGVVCDIGAYENENPIQSGPTVTVNTAEDSDDGECSFVHCTLREAINAANNTAETIAFNISGSGPFIIQPLSALPALTQPVSLDGTTQPGGAVVLDGSLAGPDADGLTLAGGDSFVRGFTITNFGCTGIVLDGAGDNLIEGNMISGNGCHGIHVLAGTGNEIQDNSITNNGLLGIALDSGDDVTANDVGDGDGGANGRQNFPVLTAAVNNASDTLVTGRLNSTADTSFTIEFFSNTSCDLSNHGEGATGLGTAVVTTNSKGDALFAENVGMVGSADKFVTVTATDENGNTSEFSHCVAIGPNNDIWPNALELTVVPDLSPTIVQQFLDQSGRSRWYKFSVQPNSRLHVALTNLPENYDVTVYKDIGGTFNTLLTEQDLAHLDAEFAPNAFNPDGLAPDAFSSDAFAPDAFLPDAFLPDAFLPDAFLPDAFLPDAFLPDAYSPDAFLPDAFLPDAFLPDAFLPDAFLPDAFLPDAFLPDAFLSAQTRSLLALSAYGGTTNENVSLNTWLNDGDFYIRVRGRQGAYSPAAPFHLEVRMTGNVCGGVSPIMMPATTIPEANDYKSLILTDLARMAGSAADQTILEARLADLANRPEVAGAIIDLSLDAKVLAANMQADAHPACPYAKNLVFEAIKEIITGYRELNPNLEYITIIGNDEVIPYERYPDLASLANEKNYVVPVLNDTASQSVHRLGYILTQDGYGSSLDLSFRVNAFPVPDLAVGRLVETMADVTTLLDAYLSTANGVIPAPTSVAATGYDFIEDAAKAIVAELEAGTGVTANTLILTRTVSPADERAWTAEQLADLILDNRHDVTFLGAHFSANSLLAADYSTRLTTDDLVTSEVDLTNGLVFSIGCHAGYNIVNEHGVPDVTQILDWPQAFTQKGATLIASTAYAYGHTDFLKYSERLHLLFSQQLRTGSGPVSIGQAMVAAKQEYLATTPEIRGIDEKSLLATTIFGLPMLRVDMPGQRLTPAGTTSVAGSTNPFTTDPGETLGLSYADVTITPSLTTNTVTLTNINDDTENVTATYLSGSDGVVANPAEIVLPLELENISVPGTLPRGIGFRGGSYSDLPDIFPLTNAGTTEIRGIHRPFASDIFYPVKLWQINHFDLLSNPANGQSQLAVTSAQFQSDNFGAMTGILRGYSSMDFRIYYSDNIATYGGGSTPALSAAPAIHEVTAVPESGSLYFQARVTGNPAAGVQEVWIVYTKDDGLWYPFDLEQDTQDSTLWAGSLPLNGSPAEAVGYVIQAVNGVGLVSMDSNHGAYYRPGMDTPAPDAAETMLTLEVPASSGAYATEATFSAVLMSDNAPVANKKVIFVLGSQTRQAMTDANGRAMVQLLLLGLPDIYQIQASFQGTGQFLPATTMADFEITKQATELVLEPQPAIGLATDANIVEATLSAGGRRLMEKTVFFVVTGAGGSLSRAVISDNEGAAVLGELHLPAGTYNVTAYFSGLITLHSGIQVDLDDEHYLPTTAGGTITLLNSPPQGMDDAYEADEDMPLVVAAPGVLANDSDVNGDGLTAVMATNPAHGTVTLNSNGSFTYTPEADYNGPDSFIYRADDGTDSSNLATVMITVNAVNDVPGAVDDGYSVVTGNMLMVNPPGVLGNDSDVDGDSLTAVLQSGPSNGSLVLNGDGSFGYSPSMGFVGDDSFTYRADDGTALSSLASVTIMVLPANSTPDCSGATTSVTHIWPPDKRFVTVDILGVTDADGDPIIITIDSIFQDEPVGQGSNSPDGLGVGTATAQVRAERAGNGDGRVYHVGFTAADGQGGMCSTTLRLPVVDHDQRGEEIDLIDDGPNYDSTESS
jgi:CSLREA domain-containing protein